MIWLREYFNENFDLDTNTEDLQEIFAHVNTTNITQESKYCHTLIKAGFEEQINFNVLDEGYSIEILSKAVDEFILKKYNNKKVFFIEQMSCEPYKLQCHYIIEQ